jgi:hypothetical protein
MPKIQWKEVECEEPKMKPRYGQWEEVEWDKSTGFLDKEGVEILIGDKVSYRRKIRSTRRWDGKTGRVIVTPGHYKMVTAQVVGCIRMIKRHYSNNSVLQLEALQLKENNSYKVFRVYRADNLTVVFSIKS